VGKTFCVLRACKSVKGGKWLIDKKMQKIILEIVPKIKVVNSHPALKLDLAGGQE
jgi:hypothetical protein